MDCAGLTVNLTQPRITQEEGFDEKLLRSDSACGCVCGEIILIVKLSGKTQPTVRGTIP